MLPLIVALIMSTSAYAAEADSAMQRIKRDKVVSIGFRESAVPFAFLDDQKRPAGFSIEI
jgi:glutamate/aspartate transport system substrate-binding protein